jgi:6-pyruvoyltetrahydropterin/6-carboxytetrahydropterin synthase
MYYSTKNYPPSLGLSACFRQHGADSHCHLLHGYSLGFRFKFAATTLDRNGWVVDFGGLKKLKEELVLRFDHRLLVAYDDPYREQLLDLHGFGIANVAVVERTGCEAFAAQMFHFASSLVNDGRVECVSCECYEHDANSALYEKGQKP